MLYALRKYKPSVLQKPI